MQTQQPFPETVCVHKLCDDMSAQTTIHVEQFNTVSMYASARATPTVVAK